MDFTVFLNYEEHSFWSQNFWVKSGWCGNSCIILEKNKYTATIHQSDNQYARSLGHVQREITIYANQPLSKGSKYVLSV